MKDRRRAKVLLVSLVLVFLLLQYKLWFASGGLLEMWHLGGEIDKQEAKVSALAKRNQKVLASVNTIKNNHQSIEAKARKDLGMVKSGEEYYQIIEVPKGQVSSQQQGQADENTTK